MECWSDELISEPITPLLDHLLRRGHEFLPDPQLGILRKENLANEDFVRGKIAGGDRGGIIDMLERGNEDGAGVVFESVIVRPDREDGFGGIAGVNLEALFAREIEGDAALGDI